MLLLFVKPAYSAQNIKIEIPEIIYSDEESFTLGQIAKISGGATRTRRILSAIQVFADNGRLSRNEVLRAINDSDASDARIELYMPKFSRIEAPAYEGNFTETGPISQNNSRSVNDLIPVIKSLSAWDGNIEVSASSPVPDGRLIDPASIVPGTGSVNLRFRDDNGRVRSLNVRLTWLQKVMIASHNIKKGDRISPNDLITREMKITRPGVYASSPNEIAGFTANRNIKQGEAILLNSLTSSNIVKRGRQVKIIARYGAASASADGILLEDGRPGDWVKVRRVDDKRITLRAQIINENTVEVRVE
ncbi:MAG: flagellar basal body P-ring formation protein FlgA [Synergistaceae bacterium]|nr:flagellar basal body P-ring formation protein FlgA [Synergistaceae bacterium]